mmetsp:Transcript_35734/g.79506  ORF Transcript_35734/g.79506 Transcript_35734/m.79506 type:complete len:192 (-) Transcript_35734:789-1364(-)
MAAFEAKDLCKPFPYPVPHIHWILFIAVSAPHFLYAFIWFLPKLWRRAFGNQSVQVFATTALLGKIVQFSSVGLWIWVTRPTGVCFSLPQVDLWQWLTGVSIVVMGQALNHGVYATLGVAGVYYGKKLGHKVPWVYGWPFNFCPHPQYVGSAITVWGALITWHNQLPEGAWFIASVWSALYFITGLFEQYL